jgi:hypothetical protein
LISVETIVGQIESQALGIAFEFTKGSARDRAAAEHNNRAILARDGGGNVLRFINSLSSQCERNFMVLVPLRLD